MSGAPLGRLVRGEVPPGVELIEQVSASASRRVFAVKLTADAHLREEAEIAMQFEGHDGIARLRIVPPGERPVERELHSVAADLDREGTPGVGDTLPCEN